MVASPLHRKPSRSYRPLQSLTSLGSSERMGCSLPVLPLRSPNAQPIRFSFTNPSPKPRRLGPSSPEVRFSLTVFPEALAPNLSIESTSPGVFAPSTLIGSESSRLSGLPGPAPRRFLCGNPSAISRPLITVPLLGFPNLSAVSPSPSRPAIFRQVAFLGFRPTGVSSFHEAPTTLRRQHPLLTFFPRIALSPS